ncbi:hypothetical protein N7449_006651 [Penicillium cf. viridicatum]|uniref:Uncharacterized protein n=1 Tax=Penicillium cf. viridicatum TaxID=2972119 RepID=A0A9W9JGZ5_9EURO|nr:hypothetical protein N7449_006651 [Penicillium cf. viridicatum]
MPTYMILKELESAIYVAIWVGEALRSYDIVVVRRPDHAAARNKLKQTKNKCLEDKKRLLAESKAIFDREAYLMEQLQRAENRMAKDGVDDASLDLISVAGGQFHLYCSHSPR